MKTIFKNLLKALAIICYFLILIYAATKMDKARLVEDIKVFAGAFLVVGIIILERAYKNDDGRLAITSVELLVLAFYSLSIMHMVDLLKYDLKTAFIISAIVTSAYYIIKGIIIYTKERKELLANLSDISDIVKKDKPVKKEARKRGNSQEESNSEKSSRKNVKLKESKETKKEKTTKAKEPKELKEPKEAKEEKNEKHAKSKESKEGKRSKTNATKKGTKKTKQ